MSKRSLKPSIVLVADRTLSADYKILFEGIFATMQTTQVPAIAMRRFVSPPVKTDNPGRATSAPLGVRRVESALLKYLHLSADDVVCTTPEFLPKLLGPWVKVVGVSSSDPLGQGMSNTTTTSFWDGELYTRYWMRLMLEKILDTKRKYGFKVVGGGAGAWQWNRYDDPIASECIDVVLEGYFEDIGPEIFKTLLESKPTESYYCQDGTAVDKVAPITAPSMLGIIELSRGCGRGCKFCTMSRKKMSHLPVDAIMSDLQMNVSRGQRSVVSGSEDFFRYGSDSIKPDFDKLCALLNEMRKIKELSFMQIDHANITSVMQLSDNELIEIRKLLTWNSRSDYLWVNMGVESANGHLVAANGPGKVAPCSPRDWQDVVCDTVDKMSRTGFFSVISLVLGLPGETSADVDMTYKLVKYLEKKNAVIFPVFYEPYSTDQIEQGMRFSVEKMRPEHLALYSACYEINFRKVPLLFWDNQRAGGVSWIKRAAMRILGKTEVRAWRKKFIAIGKQLDEKCAAV